MPPGAAHSPIAKTCGSEVRQLLVDDDAAALGRRRGRAARASSSRGRMPAENDHDLDVELRPPSANASAGRPCRRRRAISLGHRAGVDAHAEVARSCRRSVAPPASSTCPGISRGANSTTWVSRPSCDSALAASRPSRPPPMTAPPVAVRAGRRGSPRGPRWCGRRSSRRGRRPATGGTNGAEPVASTSASYVSDLAVLEQSPTRRLRSNAVDRRSPSTQPHARVVVLPVGQQATARRRRRSKKRGERDPVVRRRAAPRRRRRCRGSR